MTYKDDYMSWSSGFSASLFLQNEIVPNSYSIEITFETLTNNILHQNISFERVKHMINVYLQNAMIVKYDNPKIDLLKNFKVNFHGKGNSFSISLDEHHASSIVY